MIIVFQVSSLNNQILTLTNERDKALVEAEDLGIKLANTKHELNRLQREHIKLQLEQEKVLEKFESVTEYLKTGQGDKLELSEKSGTVYDEGKMYKKGNTVNMYYYSDML